MPETAPLLDVQANSNTCGDSGQFIQMPARTQVYANSVYNRTVQNQNALAEPVVSAAHCWHFQK